MWYVVNGGLPYGPQKDRISRHLLEKYRYLNGLFRTVGNLGLCRLEIQRFYQFVLSYRTISIGWKQANPLFLGSEVMGLNSKSVIVIMPRGF